MATTPKTKPPIRRDTSAGRFYVLPDGTRLPSVTHILSCLGKPALVNWAANTERAMVLEAAADLYADIHHTPQMSRPTYIETLTRRIGVVKAHKKESEKATEIGSQAHKLIEHTLRKALGQPVGPEPRVGKEALWAFMAFEDWARAHDVQPLRVEETVWSRTHGYAGTMDLLARVDGQIALVDFKTSKAVYAESHLQNAAYQVALAEMGHEDAEVGYIVRIPKNTTDPAFEAVQCPPRAELFPTFLAVAQVWRWWHAAEQASKAAWQAKRNAAQAVA